MSKYGPLREWLTRHSERAEVTISFVEIETLLDSALPSSARVHRAWWANHRSHVQALSWLDAGWSVDVVDQTGGSVRFCRS